MLVLPEEREWYQRFCQFGLVDTFRQLNPTVNDHFRGLIIVQRFDDNRGLRIDHILAVANWRNIVWLQGSLWIRAMEKSRPDHAPIWAEFK